MLEKIRTIFANFGMSIELRDEDDDTYNWYDVYKDGYPHPIRSEKSEYGIDGRNYAALKNELMMESLIKFGDLFEMKKV
jgi:hypothetical protein